MKSLRILSAFQIYGPATVDEIERATGKTRPTRYGVPARVLEVAR